MRNRAWDDDRHVLTVYRTGDLDYPLDIDVEHPQTCKVYVGCVGPCMMHSPGEYHVDTYYDCPAGYAIEDIGPDEALFGLSTTTRVKGYNLMDEPPENVGPVWIEVLRQLESSDEARVPLKLHWSGGYDHWNEWDELLEVDLHVAV